MAPGPLAAQLGIYIGFVHYGLLGATLTGLAFVLPSFLMVVLLGIIYQAYSGLSWMRDVFYGVGAAVIGIIAISAYKLTLKSVGKLNLRTIKANWLLWAFYLIAIAVTVITQHEQILLFTDYAQYGIVIGADVGIIVWYGNVTAFYQVAVIANGQ